MRPLAILLWLAVLCSLSVYGYRIWRRVTQGPKSEREAGETGRDSPTEATPGTASFLIQNPVTQEPPPFTARAEPDAAVLATPLGPPPPAPPAAPHPAPVSAPAPVIPSAAPPVTPPTMAQPLVAPERRGARSPIAEALAGIVLPCDLSPIVSQDLRIDEFDVSFVTTTFDVARVQASLVGELVRLGFGVTPTSTHRLVASRPDAELTVTLIDDPASATREGRPLYPTVPDQCVVARFTS